MTSPKRTLSLEAARRALRVRQGFGCGPAQALEPVDLAERIGVQVLFVDVGSMEGMYLSDSGGTILLPSERPSGRLAFSCGHELGHHVFGHGTRLDTLMMEERESHIRDEEWLANMFAAFLLMPASAVRRGFRERGWNLQSPDPIRILRVAQWLGVGYSTLVNQMTLSLGLLSRAQSAPLLKASPRDLCGEFLGRECTADLTIADDRWTDRAVDLRTGGQLALPMGSKVEGSVLRLRDGCGEVNVFEAVEPGNGRVLFQSGRALFVRVARRSYSGRARFRFLPDPDFEE